MTNYHDMVLALAGIYQSTALVNQLAMKGKVENQDAFHATINSLFQTRPENTLAVFGGQIHPLKLGLETLIEQLSTLDDKNIVNYWSSLLGLEGILNKNPEAKSELAQRIQRLQEQRAYHKSLDAQMISIMANIYVDIISPLGRRIHIIGNENYLQQQFVQDKVRACLLAGIRATVLWRQVGGNKWRLLFFRSKIINAAKEIYSTIYP
ncbi:high frequency lysogenization protein HflD [Rodentibacter pneumotropicus]|uniref:high frequency lysogenization protein HflD n=1 Tax=Rodentibacter pneumotropicus TaxID=758 RepID=UPI000984339B|nr:high frequency lysogenization protein HflD [Rodentibacter pneumotropicus]OOF64234.1 lysogenization regulator HflD [Rodentibacter pneumotropicus]